MIKKLLLSISLTMCCVISVFAGNEDEDELKKLEDKASYLYNLSPDIPEGSLDRPIMYRNPYYSVVFLARNPIEFQEKTCYTVAQEICSIIIRDDTTYDKDTFESDVKGVDIVIQESKKILSGTIQDPKNLLQKYRCDSLQTFLQKGHSCANHSIENNLISVVQSILCKGTGCESFSQNNLISKILAAVDKKDRNSLAISQILQAIDVEFDKLFRPLIPSAKEHIRDAIRESISRISTKQQSSKRIQEALSSGVIAAGSQDLGSVHRMLSLSLNRKDDCFDDVFSWTALANSRREREPGHLSLYLSESIFSLHQYNESTISSRNQRRDQPYTGQQLREVFLLS